MNQEPGPEYSSEAELLAEFKNYMSNPENVEKATNYLYNALVDEAILGCVFEFHYLAKTRMGEALEGLPEDTQMYVKKKHTKFLNQPKKITHSFNFSILGFL